LDQDQLACDGDERADIRQPIAVEIRKCIEIGTRERAERDADDVQLARLDERQQQGQRAVEALETDLGRGLWTPADPEDDRRDRAAGRRRASRRRAPARPAEASPPAPRARPGRRRHGHDRPPGASCRPTMPSRCRLVAGGVQKTSTPIRRLISGPPIRSNTTPNRVCPPNSGRNATTIRRRMPYCSSIGRYCHWARGLIREKRTFDPSSGGTGTKLNSSSAMLISTNRSIVSRTNSGTSVPWRTSSMPRRSTMAPMA